MKTSSSYPSFLQFVGALILMVGFSSLALGQQTAARPDRGTMPGATYQTSDIENISLSNELPGGSDVQSLRGNGQRGLSISAGRE